MRSTMHPMSTPDTHNRGTRRTPAPSNADDLPDYAPIPQSAFGPALNEQGYYVGRVERNLYWVTDGTYQSAFLTTSDGVVLLDAPPTIGHNIQRAVDEIASANGVSNKVTHLIYSHHHADHAGASVALRQERRSHRARGDAEPPAARRRPCEAGARGDLPGQAHARDRRRAHRAGLARHQSLARQHLHPPARPRHAHARRHRQPGLGAGLPEQPHRGRAGLHRGAGHRAHLPVEALHRRPHGQARHARRHRAAPAVHGGHRRQLEDGARHRRPHAVLR